jgi:hypothetical protein
MSEKKQTADTNELPGAGIKGHRQTDEHSGVEAIFDMGDYALSEDEKIAFGIHRLELPEIDDAGEVTATVDSAASEESAGQE